MDALAQVGQVGEVLGPAAVQLVEDDLARGGGHGFSACDLREFGVLAGGGRGHGLVGGVAGQDGVAFGEQFAALPDQVVVAPGVAVQFEVDAFGDALGVADDPVRALVGDEAVVV